jgi:hypothetical protein
VTPVGLRGGKGRSGKASGPSGRRKNAAPKARDKTTARLTPRPLPHDPDAGPDFFCIGAQKGGTRWLYDQLQLHPDFWMPPVKELHYFDRRAPAAASVNLLHRAEENLRRTNRRQAKLALRPLDQRDVDFLAAYVKMRWWLTDLEAYARLFSLKGGLLSGDITPDYSTLSDRTIAKLMSRFPKAKVIFIARDPVERAWSQLSMHMRRGTVAHEVDPEAVMRQVRKRFVAARSFPTEIVARWRRHVRDDRLGIWLFDDLIQDAGTLRQNILTFLGADPTKESGAIPAAFNRKQEKEKILLSPELREHLANHFAAELKASGEAFGGAAKGWAARYGL